MTMAARTAPAPGRAGDDTATHLSEKDTGVQASSSTDTQRLSPFQRLRAKLSTSSSRRHPHAHPLSSSNGSASHAGDGLDGVTAELPEELVSSKPYRQPTLLRRDHALPPPPSDHAAGTPPGQTLGDGDDPYAALRAATPPQGWTAENAPSDGTPGAGSGETGTATEVQPPLPVPGSRTRLSWHGDTRREPGSSSGRALRSTLSALRLNSWAGDPEYLADGSSVSVPSCGSEHRRLALQGEGCAKGLGTPADRSVGLRHGRAADDV